LYYYFLKKINTISLFFFKKKNQRCVVTTDYGHLFVYNRSSEHADWSGAEPTNGGKPLALFKKLPPLPRGTLKNK